MTKKEKFRQELEKAMRENGRTSWEQGDYTFRFSYEEEGGVYTWKGEKLHITYREALYLYQRLVMGLRRKRTYSPTALQTLRNRYGLRFLVEVLCGSEYPAYSSEETIKELRRRAAIVKSGGVLPAWEESDQTPYKYHPVL
jgi:hypothetical protein